MTDFIFFVVVTEKHRLPHSYRKEVNMEKFYALSDIARLLDVQGYRIAYAISTGALPDAEQRIANKRCFSEADVQRIARHFEVEIPTQCGEGTQEGGK